MEIAASMEELIGNTPIVRLVRVTAGVDTPIVAKLETTNPGGSVKDRPALWMINAAEKEGLLRPGGTIIEPTSGNTGVGLAIVAAQRGYKCIFVMTDKVSEEKVTLLRAYGAEVVVCPVAVAPDDPQSYYSTAERLVAETPTRSGPTSTSTRSTRCRTTRPPAPKYGARPMARSPISWPVLARETRSAGSADTSKSRTPTSR